jgi:hypothetical protein
MSKKLINLFQNAAKICIAKSNTVEKTLEKYFVSGNRISDILVKKKECFLNFKSN